MNLIGLLTMNLLFVTFSFAQVTNKDQLLQISTIDALLGGIYDGETTVEQLLKQGDFGIGTFNTLDGEMVVLNGICYQIKSDGKVNVASGSMKTPFAAITPFETDNKIFLKGPYTLDQLQAKIDSIIPSVNMFYAIKISARFLTATARSVPSQKPPYIKLIEITKSQPVFSFENKKGTLVGFRCPPYVKGLNVPGYHLHLLTDDKKQGGHLLSMNADSITVEIDKTDSFKMVLPHDVFFARAYFSIDKENELEKVEK